MNRISRRTMAAAVAGAVALGGASTLVLGMNPAQAATQTFNLYSQTVSEIQGAVSAPNQSVTLTVSPTSAAPGTPIEIQVSSSTLGFANGPVAQSAAGGTEIDAIVSFNGQDLLLRGPIPSVASPKNASVINSGWVVSSTAGNSSGATTHSGCATSQTCGLGGGFPIAAASAAPATTGLGNAVITKSSSPAYNYNTGDGSVTVGADNTGLVAPAVGGTYGVTLKAIVQNAITGSSTTNIGDGFDNFYSLASTSTALAYFSDTSSSYLAYTPAVNLTVPVGLTVTSITGQRPGVTQYVRAGDKINVTGSAWGPSQASLSVQICAAGGIPCFAPLTNTLSTDANGVLSGQIPITAGPAGNAAIKVSGVGGSKLIPITNLAARAVEVSPAAGAPGTVATVSGSGYDSNAAVSVAGLQGVNAGIPTFSTDPAVSVAAAADGTWSTSYTINDPLTTLVGGVETPPFGNPALDGATTGFAVEVPASATTKFDFDGDGKADRAVFRNGKWIVGNSSTNTATTTYNGSFGDVPVAADFDGDGATDRAVFRNGKWIIKQSSDNTTVVSYTGAAGDVPVAGDFDGDGVTDLAVFRNGKWIIKTSSNGSTTTSYTGAAGDIAVAADYDGDGVTDLAVFRNGKWIVKQSSDDSSSIGYLGSAGDVPAAALPQASGPVFS